MYDPLADPTAANDAETNSLFNTVEKNLLKKIRVRVGPLFSRGCTRNVIACTMFSSGLVLLILFREYYLRSTYIYEPRGRALNNSNILRENV